MEQQVRPGGPRVTILVGCHKPGPVLSNGVYKPIRLGAALSSPAAPSGKADEAQASPDEERAFAAMPGDDSGDNISQLNRQFCELTAVYWAWKNYAALGNPEYFGLAHYRRLLALDDRDARKRIIVDSLDEVAPALVSEDAARSLVSRYDLCVPAPLPVTLASGGVTVKYCNVREHYAAVHHARDLELAFAAAASLYPEYTASIREYAASHKSYLFNMFIMRKDIFLYYAKWLFSILFTVHKQADYTGYSEYQSRVPAFIAERLTGVFIRRMLGTKGVRMATLSTITIRC